MSTVIIENLSVLRIKNLGIVGVVQTIEHLVWTTDDDSSQSQGNELFQTIDDIDDVAAKTAAQYLGKLHFMCGLLKRSVRPPN